MGGRLGSLALAAVLGVGTIDTARAALLNSGPQTTNAPMAFQADEVQYDEQLSLTVAKGHVEISQGPQVLLADLVTYNQRTDTVTASGHVSLMTTTGEVIFADYMELRDQMNDAFAGDVRMLLSDRSRLVANAARRTNGNHIDARRAVYSPCDLCKDDPTQPPAWQLKARQITDDKELKQLEFRDAIIEIDGWPIFYTPYMSAPDPSVKRASGFMVPSFGSSNNVGFHFSLPYYWVIGPDADMTLTPRFTSAAGVVLAGEFRERFSNGELYGLASINGSNVNASPTNPTNLPDQLRGHVDAKGVWDLDDEYRAGFALQRVSDQTYLQRFGFTTPLLSTMISRAYFEGFHPNGSTDVNAYVFEPLTPGLHDQTQPIVLPVMNRNWQLDPDKLGGTFNLNANLLNIIRETGTQTRRLSLGGTWDRTFRDGLGSEYKFLASVRGDGYSINNLSNVSNPDLPSGYFSQNGQPPLDPVARTFLTGRAFPQIGLTWDYPVIHRGEDMTFLVQPAAATFIGPTGGNRHTIPNEDSLGYQFKDSDLFRADRMQGYDLLDTGQRVDYGLKLGAYDKDGGSYRALIGQSYRAEPNPFIPPGSGADQRLSDVVGRVSLSPTNYLDLIYRFRLDRNTLGNKSQELSLATGPNSFRVSANYLLIAPEQVSQTITVPGSGQTILFGKREQISLGATARLTEYWTVTGTETINLTNATNIVNGIATPQASSSSLGATLAATYQDECMAFITSLTQSGITNGDVRPGYSVTFSVVFKNLGEFGGNIFAVAPGGG